MKNISTKLICLFTAIIFCQLVTAQSRIKQSYPGDHHQSSSSLKAGKPDSISNILSGYYMEGFENAFPPESWQIVDVLDTSYTWSSSSSADYPAAYEGTFSAYMRYAFSTAGEDWLITPKFSVVTGDSLSFQFKLEYIGYPPDSTFILISTTDSALSSFTTVLDFYAEGLNYPGESSNWHYKSYDLSAYAGQDIYVAFKNKNELGDGIFIDQVELGTRPSAEAAALSIDMDEFYPAGISNPKATIKNEGGAAQTFDVTMNISGGYASTKSITLASQSSALVSFDPWNAAIGNYTMNVQTLLANDANPANDTISSSLKVLEPFTNYGWSTHDPLVIPTFGSAVASVNTAGNSRLFVMGGYGELTIIPDAFEYDINFNTWAGIAPLPIECTYAASATANGKVFVFGGRTLGTPEGSTQIYDYTTDSWSTGSPMPTPVVTAAYATYKDSLVYIVGGLIDATGGAVSMVQIYDTYTDTWTYGTAKPGAPVYSLRGGIIKNKMVIAGGVSGITGAAVGTTYVGEIDTLNPAHITWTSAPDHPAGKYSRGGSAISVDKNSSLVIFAGGSLDDPILSVTDKTFAFDFNSNTWKLGPNKPTARNLFNMAPIIQNDSVYLVAAGGDPGGAQIYHSEQNEWLNLGHYLFTTGIKENNFITSAALFPNPAGDATNLTVNLMSSATVKIRITDVSGKTVMNVCDKILPAGNNNISIQTKNLPLGIYFCVLNANGNVVTKKLLKD